MYCIMATDIVVLAIGNDEYQDEACKHHKEIREYLSRENVYKVHLFVDLRIGNTLDQVLINGIEFIRSVTDKTIIVHITHSILKHFQNLDLDNVKFCYATKPAYYRIDNDCYAKVVSNKKKGIIDYEVKKVGD